MKVLRLSLRHHLAGASMGIFVLFAVSQLLAIWDPQSEKFSSPPDPHSYALVSQHNYVGLFRVGAAKALRHDRVVKLGYSVNELCSVPFKENVLSTSTGQRVTSFRKTDIRWGNPYVLASNSQTIREICKSNGITKFAITDSNDVRKAMLKVGKKPLFVALSD